MSDTTDELVKVKQSLASIRAALHAVGNELDDSKGFHFFRSWLGRVDELASFVEEVASQVRYLAANVETICQIIEKNDSSRSG
jgi:hypothetical protein